jgi:hypothetical protein
LRRLFSEGAGVIEIEKPWYSFLTEPPDADVSGCIEALYADEQDEPQMAVLNLYHYANGQSKWGHGIRHPSQPHRWWAQHPEYIRWRFVGPPVPEKTDDKTIFVWRFRDAPGELRAYSMHGGDEDWVVLLPEDVDGWPFTHQAFGSQVSEHPLPDGRMVLIAAHA